MICVCPEAGKPMTERGWLVIDRLCNHSAFSGYRETPSKYSAVRCFSCCSTWRTKAGYVKNLKDAPANWFR